MPDGTASPWALSATGWRRARALAELFAPENEKFADRRFAAPPSTIFASGANEQEQSLRPQQTVTPLASKLALPIRTVFTRGDEAVLVRAATSTPGVVLIVWEHKAIPDIAHLLLGDIGNVPDWPPERFDLVWAFDREDDSDIWSFSQTEQLPLPDGSSAIALAREAAQSASRPPRIFPMRMPPLAEARPARPVFPSPINASASASSAAPLAASRPDGALSNETLLRLARSNIAKIARDRAASSSERAASERRLAAREQALREIEQRRERETQELWAEAPLSETGSVEASRPGASFAPAPPPPGYGDAPRSSRGGSGGLGWLILAGAAATLAGALIYSGAVGAFFAWVAKSLIHSAVPIAPTVSADGTIADVSAFAPPRAAPGETFLVQVFVHDADADESAISRLAKESDSGAERRGVATLDVEIRHGDRLDFVLDAPGFTIEDAQQCLIWRGRPRSCAFLVNVPEDFSGAAAQLRVRVLRQAVPIGQIRFSVDVIAAAAPHAIALAGDSARRYRRAFLSYASSDRAEVLKRAQGLKAASVDFFNDLLSLEPGERWEKTLYSEIESCDLFLLFWSQAASDSVWVNREIDHALACSRQRGSDRPEILPIILEGPPPPRPPDSLADRHFSDPLLYVIAAMDKLAASRPAD